MDSNGRVAIECVEIYQFYLITDFQLPCLGDII